MDRKMQHSVQEQLKNPSALANPSIFLLMKEIFEMQLSKHTCKKYV